VAKGVDVGLAGTAVQALWLKGLGRAAIAAAAVDGADGFWPHAILKGAVLLLATGAVDGGRIALERRL